MQWISPISPTWPAVLITTTPSLPFTEYWVLSADWPLLLWLVGKNIWLEAQWLAPTAVRRYTGHTRDADAAVSLWLPRIGQLIHQAPSLYTETTIWQSVITLWTGSHSISSNWTETESDYGYGNPPPLIWTITTWKISQALPIESCDSINQTVTRSGEGGEELTSVVV